MSDEVGYLDQFEGDALVEEGEPVDLELSTGVVANNDSFAVTASVRALDETFVSAPMVRFELSEGVSVASLPDGCDVVGSVVDCNVAGFLESGSLPTPFESVDIEFTVADGAVSPMVTVTATSFRNSLEQDPDPGNNVTEIQLASSSAPESSDDEASAMIGEGIIIDVLENDFDANDDLDPTTLSIETQPSLGTATIVDDGDGPEIEYNPTNSGTDSFTYQVCDETGLCDTATVTVTVIAESDCTIIGTSGSDALVGTSGDDVICGLGGADDIDGGSGNDLIFGGKGKDVINGGDGIDQIHGGRGADTITGDAGNDVIFGGRGADSIDGGAGDDVIRGRRGADTLLGGDGDDVLYGGKGDDMIRGGDGEDEVHGNRGADKLYGNDDNDELFGGRGADLLRGGKGDDTLRGRRGNDLLWGNSGNDDLRGGKGIDTGDGGTGTDTCRNIENESRCEH